MFSVSDREKGAVIRLSNSFQVQLWAFDIQSHNFLCLLYLIADSLSSGMNNPCACFLGAFKEQLEKMIAFKRDEEQRRFGSDLSDKPFSEYKIFDSIQNEELRKTFETMQNIYVFDPADRINFDAIISVIQGLQEVFFEQDRTFIEPKNHTTPAPTICAPAITAIAVSIILSLLYVGLVLLLTNISGEYHCRYNSYS